MIKRAVSLASREHYQRPEWMSRIQAKASRINDMAAPILGASNS